LTNGSTSTYVTSPSIVAYRGEFLVTASLNEYAYFFGTPGGSYEEHSTGGLRLDANGAPIGSPFVVSERTWPGRRAIATDGFRHLVVWNEGPDLWGAFLDAATPQQSGPLFELDKNAGDADVTFDGRDFVIAYRKRDLSTIAVMRITGNAAQPPSIMSTEPTESGAAPVIAASPSLPALVAFESRLPTYDAVTRAGLLFAHEIESRRATLPSQPVIIGCTQTGDFVTVHWLPVDGASGIAIELRMEDGVYRQIGVDAGSATSTQASLAGLRGDAVRVRAWNGAGLSTPSQETPILRTGRARPTRR
jgi:hypothetical protein